VRLYLLDSERFISVPGRNNSRIAERWLLADRSFVLLNSEQLADRTLSRADGLRSVEGDSPSGGPTISLERPFPARRIDRLDDRVFNTLMFHAPS
jgi:hypothetical protein